MDRLAFLGCHEVLYGEYSLWNYELNFNDYFKRFLPMTLQAGDKSELLFDKCYLIIFD